ncbi:LytTR family DNA-binding domain-containing protein, partial [Streptococcus canis]|uniref:LytTR family DNA-binding domain-containing protein n=2 Tax=Streptococcus canis TaxID=1329 RepID=UPI0011575DD9
HSQLPQLPNTDDQTFSRLEKALYKICTEKCCLFTQFVERIESAIEYTLEKVGMSVAQDAFKFETSLSQVQVPFNKILYFETSPTVHKVILHTIDERLEFYASISEIEKADERLYRCHKSFVVNPGNIEKLDKERKIVYFNGGKNCFVSRVKMKGLKERIQ